MFKQKVSICFGLFLLGIINVSSTSDYPLINNRAPRTSITIGPCTWVISRTCPDNDIKFFLFTQRNLHDRQYIHIDETKRKSNLSQSYFDPRNPTKIIIHGYNSDMYLKPLISMKDEYLQIRDYNLFYVDWSTLSTGPCYFSAAHNTRHAGNCIAQLVERILDEGSANVHLIGFSLGAHIPNYVAQGVGSFVLPRITGLDPAMPLFITASNDNKLDSSDAAFVDVIHTNAFVQGKVENCGHVDFYMNGGIIQPGCEDNPFACSHHRAADYYTESIRSYKGFWGWPCSSYISYLLGLCPPTKNLVEAGENCNVNSAGMFLVTTNDQTPFAKGKWPEFIKRNSNGEPSIDAPYNRYNPFASNGVDQWGKLDSSFNNLGNYPTPFPQDLIGTNWPYFNEAGTNEITNILRQNSDTEIKTNSWRYFKNSKKNENNYQSRTNNDEKTKDNAEAGDKNSINYSKFENKISEKEKVNSTKKIASNKNDWLSEAVFEVPNINEH